MLVHKQQVAVAWRHAQRRMQQLLTAPRSKCSCAGEQARELPACGWALRHQPALAALSCHRAGPQVAAGRPRVVAAASVPARLRAVAVRASSTEEQPSAAAPPPTTVDFMPNTQVHTSISRASVCTWMCRSRGSEACAHSMHIPACADVLPCLSQAASGYVEFDTAGQSNMYPVITRACSRAACVKPHDCTAINNALPPRACVACHPAARPPPPQVRTRPALIRTPPALALPTSLSAWAPA